MRADLIVGDALLDLTNAQTRNQTNRSWSRGHRQDSERQSSRQSDRHRARSVSKSDETLGKEIVNRVTSDNSTDRYDEQDDDYLTDEDNFTDGNYVENCHQVKGNIDNDNISDSDSMVGEGDFTEDDFVVNDTTDNNETVIEDYVTTHEDDADEINYLADFDGNLVINDTTVAKCNIHQ